MRALSRVGIRELGNARLARHAKDSPKTRSGTVGSPSAKAPALKKLFPSIEHKLRVLALQRKDEDVKSRKHLLCPAVHVSQTVASAILIPSSSAYPVP